MKLHIAGRDRSADIGRELVEAARSRRDETFEGHLLREGCILDLSRAAGPSEYLSRHVRLLRGRTGVDPTDFGIRAGHGFSARVRAGLRGLLWRVLRYQHDWVAFRQNGINVQLAYELEFEKQEREAKTAELERRVRELERRLDVAPRTGGTAEGEA